MNRNTTGFQESAPALHHCWEFKISVCMEDKYLVTKYTYKTAKLTAGVKLYAVKMDKIARGLQIHL